MNTNEGKYFFIPDWLLQENDQTIHAYIYILNEINNNDGELVTTKNELAKTLKITERQVRTVLSKMLSKNQIKVSPISNRSTSISLNFMGIIEDAKKIKPVAAKKIKEEINKNSSKPTFKERKETFVEDLKNYAHLYDKDMLNDFYRYWSESDAKEEKMRFEYQKTWQLNLRLITWFKNAKKQFGAKTNTEKPKEEKIGRTSIETIKKNAEYNGQY